MGRLYFFCLLVVAACSITPGAGSDDSAQAASGLARPTEAREVFREAVRRFDAGDHEGAKRFFEGVAGELPVLRDWTLAYLARIDAEAGREKNAEKHWTALRSEYPDSVWRGEADLALAEAARDEGAIERAAGLVEEARRRLGGAPAEARALGLAAELARLQGKMSAARELEAKARAEYPGTAAARRASELAWSEREQVALASLDAAMEEIERRRREGDTSRGLTLVDRARELFRDHRDFPRLHLLHAAVLKSAGRTEDALAAYQRLRKLFPGHPASRDSLYREASILWNRDDDAPARRLFDEYVRQSPHGEHAPESRYAGGRIEQAAGRCREAVRRYDDLVRTHPRSRLADEARWSAAWCEYESGNFTSAARRFGDLGGRGADRAPSGLYWRGRALERVDGPARTVYEAILDEYPESHYATMAERRLDRPKGSALDTGILPPLSSTTRTSPPAGMHLDRFEVFEELGLLQFARRELSAYLASARPSPSIDWTLSAWRRAAGWEQVVRLAIRNGHCEIPGFRLEACYPPAFREEAERHGRRRRVDPLLVMSLMRQESLFDPDIRSPANAIGLMQLLPSTAERVARGLGEDGVDPFRLTDPETNVRLGTTYLRSLIDRYEGSIVRALAAYNAGEGATDRWISLFGEDEEDEFIEQITYRETRDYVKKVLGNLRLYRALYGENAATKEKVDSGTRASEVDVATIDPDPEWHPQGPHEHHPDGQRRM